MSETIRNYIKGVFFCAIALYCFISLVSYVPRDIPFEAYPRAMQVHNLAGPFGANLGWAGHFVFGWASYLVPFIFLIWGSARIFQHEPTRLLHRIIGFVISVVSLSLLFGLLFTGDNIVRCARSGVLGLVTSSFIMHYLGRVGGSIMAGALAVLALFLATEFLFFTFLVRAFQCALRLIHMAGYFLKTFGMIILRRKRNDEDEEDEEEEEPRRSRVRIRSTYKPKRKSEEEDGDEEEEEDEDEEEDDDKAVDEDEEDSEEFTVTRPKKSKKKRPSSEIFALPSFDLLDEPPEGHAGDSDEDLEENARVLEETLSDFGIEVNVVDIERGPVITCYELEPAPGVKINRIVNLSDDIALAMKAASVRIVAPIPGKARVGIEVPNATVAQVYLKEILQSDEFAENDSKLTLVLGKDVSGTALISDLGDMPHLLIAGTTGSGKTVCMNSLITSILFNATPDEVKFIMVDPKMVELAMFNSLPHLITPVLTDHKKVSGALDWLVREMERRYKLFAKFAVRNIGYYNEKIDELGEDEDEDFVRLPYIVVIIDELADLMMIAAKEIEGAITRLAQLSRAVGIHLILATQRPSVDVITGVIKANFPARISFKVASKVDSRTVLDVNGADKLLGKGDMLFLRPGTSKPIRAQGSWVADRELQRVVKFIKEQQDPEYNEAIIKPVAKVGMKKTGDSDPFYEDAKRLVIQSGQASASMLQRRFSLGYTRAARLIDFMEEEGIVGPWKGHKPREVLVSQYEEDEIEEDDDDIEVDEEEEEDDE